MYPVSPMNLTFPDKNLLKSTRHVWWHWNVQELDDAGSEGMRGYRPWKMGWSCSPMLAGPREKYIYKVGPYLKDHPMTCLLVNNHGDGINPVFLGLELRCSHSKTFMKPLWNLDIFQSPCIWKGAVHGSHRNHKTDRLSWSLKNPPQLGAQQTFHVFHVRFWNKPMKL